MWPVYAIVFAAAFLAVLLTTVLMAAVLAGGSLLAASAGLSEAALARFSVRLQEEASTGLLGLVLGGVTAVFVLALLSVLGNWRAGRSAKPAPSPESERLVERLRIDVASPVDVGLTVLGFLGLGLLIDEVVAAFALDRSGSLAAFNESIASVHGLDRVLLALFLGLGAGVSEEMFFRGFVLNRLWSLRGRAHALFASSLLFGAFHADLVHSTLATLMGFYLGACFVHSRSLLATVAAHALNNILVVLLFDVHLTLGPRYPLGWEPEGVGVGAGFSILSVAGALTSVVCLLALVRRHRGESATRVW